MDHPQDKIILLTGGGSGGHVYPLLAVAEELKRAAIAERLILKLNYFGPRDEYGGIFNAAGVEVKNIVSGKLRRYFSLSNLSDVPKFFIGLIQALFRVFWLMPDTIFSKGGTGALAVVLAGWFYRIPIIIHESDAAPGLTNLLSSSFATRIAVSFELALKYFNSKKVAWVGTPIQRQLLDSKMAVELAKETLGFDPKTPLILILGGSQGSERINQFLLANLKDLLSITQILHQTGRANYAEVEKLSRAALIDVSLKTATKSRYKAVPYFDKDLPVALSAADLIVSRAGSGTITEISAFGKPAILIPLTESASDHQRINAYEFAKSGAAEVLEESNLLPAIFLSQVRRITGNAELLQKMSSASAKFFKPGAAEVTAQEIIRLAS